MSISVASPWVSNFTDSNTMDAFGRVRTSEPTTIFDVTHQYDLNTRRMGLQRNDAGTSITHASPSAVLAVPATAGRRICHQSHRYHIYQPGKSHLIKMTGQLGNGTILAGMGYGDDDDGIFIERAATGFQIRFSSSTTANQLVAQANWNLDKLNGTGPSGITLIGNNAQHFVIDFQWQGVGRARCGFIVNGNTIYCHQFLFANVITTPYLRIGTLPIRWYAESLGTAGSMAGICASVTSEGGHAPVGRLFSNGMTTIKALGTMGTRTPFMTIRPKATFNGFVNRAQIIPMSVRALTSTADNIYVELILNGTLTGATYAVNPSTASHAEIDLAATAITGGVPTWCDYMSSQSRNIQAADLLSWPLTLKADGTADTFTICCTRIVGAADVFCAFNWKEHFDP